MEKAQAFLEAVRRAGTPMWVRHVVVPGLTDGEAHLSLIHIFKGVETLKIAGVIALGIVLVLALPKGVFRVFAAREKRQ